MKRIICILLVTLIAVQFVASSDGGDTNGKADDDIVIPMVVENETGDQSNDETGSQKAGDYPKLKDRKVESMPSFQEWKKQKLSEAAIKGETVSLEPSKSNHHHQHPNQPAVSLKGSAKRVRNYASYECGAKVIAANPEAEGTSRILNEMMDEYLLNPCKANIWFVIELCESLQPLALELANYELFSSTPQDFIVYGSDNYPTRDWIHLGSFTAMDVRTIQRFELPSQSRFLKYIKVEMNSHHGYEHYCPLSVIRIFGTSMVEEFDAIESGGEEKKFDYASENEEAAIDSFSSSSPSQASSIEAPTSEEKPASNLIGTAREAVMNMVRKAAIALSKFPSQETDSTKNELDPLVAPRTGDVLQLSLSSLKLMPWLEKRLKKCKDCGLSDDNVTSSSSPRSCNNSTPNQKLCDYIKSLLGLKTYAILCEEVNKEPLLRFRCPLISYFLNASTVGEFNELTFDKNLVPSYHVTKVLPDNHQTSFNTNAQEVSQPGLGGSSIDYPAVLTHSIVVESVSPTSVIDGSTLSSITSVLLEPNKNGSGGILQSGDLVTDLVTNTTTSNELNATLNLADQLIDINNGNNKVLEKTQPSLSTSSSTTTPAPPSTPASASSLSPSAPSSSSSSSSPSTASLPAITPPPPPSPSNNANWVPLSASQAKESVFIRMSNKIRALEVNLSLSSQYLEELSQRYRKNMDEMQRAFNRTITKLNETARVAAEKDDIQQEMLENLEARLALVEDSVSLLVVEKETMHWHFIGVHIVLLVFEIIIMVSLMSLCVKRATARLEEKYRSLPNSGLINNNTHDKRGPPGPLKRPNSCPDNFNVSPAKNKRIEDDDLIIVQPSFPLFTGMNIAKNKKRRKKKNGSLDGVGGDYDENRIHSKSSENLATLIGSSKTSKDFLGKLNLKASSCYKFDTDSTSCEFRGVKPDSCDDIARKAGGKVLSKSNSSSSSGISSLSGSNNRVLKEKQVNRNFNCNQSDKNSLKSYSSNSASSPTKSNFSWKKLLKLEKK